MDEKPVENTSSSDDDTSEDEIDNTEVTRERRSTDRPEDESSSSTSKRFYLQGNPNFGNKMQLYSRTNYFLAIYPDGTIRGTQDQNDLHTHVLLTNAGDVGSVRVKGIPSGFLLGMSCDGNLYSTTEPSDETVFIEAGVLGQFTDYLSQIYKEKDYYIGIKKSGKIKRGLGTKKNQRAVQFICCRNLL